ncbi:3-hydroxyacyl-ACP dehydratase FabZ [Campylobacter geochelonis]|uniref:3-hydroxyacyl-[acyl-carrier-protein] dehydratase FabZ n=1 Tax=Campylobacter geochelonis TaxID=1780362 RepID=A0A128EMV9_9BACT|nr:3-hydroxyacyl-ACP dehydratase FabZ [Campylobacter geochelonis]QKF70586.1 3-hydroxyacyl-[acp] dehydratase [Campylobacter geochelonis]CZE45981.1 beta-hydroxyacyl-(acyl-carrier-protein) dehydratase FabZ [Campylobacter geochelonis]CZE46652.1 beta-hydroxyacyl-(acyl-carrier-protein) dehydratase FabZ [Campylobacter geochelonis]CZE50371.1 beta-hydroxyacyl-(acyl-carrier-protein) dehydratase FabZ [Campylobacter geochelonis]
MIDINEIMRILPHRYPFLLIDRVTDLIPNESIAAYKNVTIGDQIFQGHFPGHPIYPGVMIIEGMAQAGGVLAFKSMDENELDNKVVYFMSIDKAKFRHPIRPGDRLEYRIKAIKHRGRIWVLSGEAYVDDKLVASAELQAMIMDK